MWRYKWSADGGAILLKHFCSNRRMQQMYVSPYIQFKKANFTKTINPKVASALIHSTHVGFKGSSCIPLMLTINRATQTPLGVFFLSFPFRSFKVLLCKLKTTMCGGSYWHPHHVFLHIILSLTYNTKMCSHISHTVFHFHKLLYCWYLPCSYIFEYRPISLTLGYSVTYTVSGWLIHYNGF